jgi:hypothetical protein
VNAWMKQIFKCGQVAKGNIVRRKRSSVQRYASMKALHAEVRRRRFHLIETGDQLIIICNRGEIKLVI